MNFHLKHRLTSWSCVALILTMCMVVPRNERFELSLVPSAIYMHFVSYNLLYLNDSARDQYDVGPIRLVGILAPHRRLARHHQYHAEAFSHPLCTLIAIDVVFSRLYSPRICNLRLVGKLVIPNLARLHQFYFTGSFQLPVTQKAANPNHYSRIFLGSGSHCGLWRLVSG